MLKSLFIKNFALIDELSVEFPNGLVIITGETGAGKSIIIEALGLIIGERAYAEMVRAGAEKAVVEGVFHVAQNARLQTLLQDNDLEPAEELLVRREISIRGQNRCFVNDTPLSITLLKELGELLVDLHGQHDHQSLLRVDTHIDVLDDFGGLGAMLSEFRAQYQSFLDVMGSLGALRAKERELRARAEVMAFQLQEIESVDPQEDEDSRSEEEARILENAEHLVTTTGRLYEMLYEGESSIHDQLVLARNQLENLSKIDTQFSEAEQEGRSALAIVNELAKFIQKYNATVESNPERLEFLRQRLAKLALLKKKYGGSHTAVLEHRDRIRQEISLAQNFDETLERYEREKETLHHSCHALATKLSKKRKEVGRRIDRSIAAELSKLGIQHAKFTARIEQVPIEDASSSGSNRFCEMNPKGIDRVEFLISLNLGEEEKPLARVASGGEVSRIMLALKSVLAKSDRLPILVFDEIDAGISGRIAQTVGQSMKNLSEFHQVIAITHLPQIAGQADSHFAVSKKEEKGRTTTTMKKLSSEERIREVATLLSGVEVTRAGVATAKELMGLKS